MASLFSAAPFGAGGADFHWWCSEACEAFAGKSPVFESPRVELEAIAGPAVYEGLVAPCRHRQLARSLPHLAPSG